MKRKTATRQGVVFAIGSLVLVGLWLWANRVRELSHLSVCQAHMKAIVATMKMVTNDPSMPMAPSIDPLVQLGHIRKKQAICPSSVQCGWSI